VIGDIAAAQLPSEILLPTRSNDHTTDSLVAIRGRPCVVGIWCATRGAAD
jgi:hypothetical protein